MARITDPDLIDVSSANYAGEAGINAEVYEQDDGTFGVNVFCYGSALGAAQGLASLDAVAEYLERFQIPARHGWEIGWYTPL